MRPPIADIGPPSRSRKPSVDQSVSPWADPRDEGPSTFFLTTRQDDNDEEDDRSPDGSGTGRDSMYGVQSLEETIQQTSLASSLCELSDPGNRSVDSVRPANLANFHRPADELKPMHGTVTVEAPPLRRRSTIRPFDVLPSASYRDSSQQPSDGASSRPLSPPGLGRTIESCSLPSSPKSLSNQSMKQLDDISITDELSSQALASGEEDDEPLDTSGVEPDNPSQLIMPSIRMPSRRPFTDRGKAMGRFKLLLAGASNSGKTSLIKSLVQLCEDIVHVDEVPSPVSQPPRPRPTSRSQTGPRQNAASKTTCVEIYASTKPYPTWWSDLEDSRILRRRKSTGDVVLERNLCFVDTGVVGNASSRAYRTDAVVQYMHQQLFRATSAVHASNAADFQNLLAGNGGSQVDAILYLISEDTLARDVECMQKLSELSNVIPVIAKADLLTPSQIRALQVSFHDEARKAGVKPFVFDAPMDGGGGPVPQSPFVVSSAKSSDEDNMDASLLMSPDYVQPLVASELNVLVHYLFHPDNMAWLRHSAAKKLSQRRFNLQPTTNITATQQTPQSPLSFTGSFSGLTTSSVASLCSSSDGLQIGNYGSPSYAVARLADYTRQEETLAQVRLAKWATDLQRSLQNERERYAALARGDRAVWLTERLSECIVDGTLVPISQTPGFYDTNTREKTPTKCRLGDGGESRGDNSNGTGLLIQTTSSTTTTGQKVQVEYPLPTTTTTSRNQRANLNLKVLDTSDPLGVVYWTDALKRRGWVILQIVGSFGVVGGLALWFAKSWNLSSRSLVLDAGGSTTSGSGGGGSDGSQWYWNYCFDWCGMTTTTAGDGRS